MAEQKVPYGPEAVHFLPRADSSFVRNKILNIPYAGSSVLQYLDLYYPDTIDGANHDFPLILAIHGGAWQMCDKADVQLQPMLKALDRGYAVAALNYRLSWEAKFPAQIQDVLSAICFLKTNAGMYKLDADRFAAWGGSAGAHLSAMAGLVAALYDTDPVRAGLEQDVFDLLACFIPAAWSYGYCCPKLRAVVGWYGPTDFLLMDKYLASNKLGPCDHGDEDSPESRLLGSRIALVPELVRMANPETYVSRFAPPFFLQHGIADAIVPYQHSVTLAEKIEMVAGAGKARLELLDEAGHADSAFETTENIRKILDFLDSHMV